MTKPTRLFDFAFQQLETHPLPAMIKTKMGDGWVSISTKEFVHQSEALAKGLLNLQVQPGDKIAMITSYNRQEWNVTDSAILQIGAVNVPIYPTMTETDYEYILNHSEARMIFVSDIALYEKVKSIYTQLKFQPRIFSFEKIDGVELWTSIMTEEDDRLSELLSRRNQVNTEDLATIIYTSGTTGLPKGVMLSHQNIVSTVLVSEPRLPLLESGVSVGLSFLPVCHIYERMLHYLYFHKCITVCMTNMEAIKDDLNAVHPHIFSAVPRLLEKVFDGVVQKGLANTGIKKVLFQWALNLTQEWEYTGKSAWYHLKLNIARKLVFSKVKAALGLTEIRAIASGSAALQPRLARFFNAAGIVVLEGYGLTETSPVVSVNTVRGEDMLRIGSVGKLVEGVEVKMLEDGEILVKGPNVMLGYYKQPELTAEVIKDNWFYTGDIGVLQDGFLVITDRKKEMFKTSGGKYVAPQVLENALKESLFIEQCMVIGENQKFPGALVVPDRLALAEIARQKGIAQDHGGEWLHHETIKELIWQDILKINVRFGKWEQVKSFQIVHEPFSIHKGEITPTLKLKRKKIMENYKSLVEKMFGSH
jgi:long-chain acyl-CoA synthetase